MVTTVSISYAIIVVPLSADACSISGVTTYPATNTTPSAMKIATISDCLPVPLIFQHIEESSI
jgi:hypothetical protein